jgi:putative ABC transport system permease protein
MNVLRDLRHAARLLLRAPAFSLAIIVSLGLGFAISATTMAVVNAYFVRSLPYPAADRLYNVLYARTGELQPQGLAAVDWASLSDVVEVALASDPDVLYLTEGGYTQSASCSHVTVGFLEGLGVRPALGRTLSDSDTADRAEPSVLISHAIWRDRFDLDPNVIGRRFRAYSAESERATTTMTIVGVLPEEFWTSRRVDVLLPLRQGAVTTYMVRLREGVPVGQAERRITEQTRAVATAIPALWDGVQLRSVHEQYVTDLRPVLRAVTVAAALVLVIACANVALLMLLRATRRQKEVALRTALGAGRVDVLRMLVTEGFVLSAAACAAGLALTGLTLRTLAPVIEQNLGRRVPGGPSAITVDATVVGVVAALGLVIALVLSLAPLLATWRTDLFNALRRDSQGGIGSLTGRRARSVLTAAEIAGALALLVGCGVMVRTVGHLTNTDLGFETAGIVRAQFSLPSQPYRDKAALVGFYDRLLERMDSSASLADWPSFAQTVRHPIEIEGVDTTAPGDLQVGVMSVTGTYFQTLGMRAIDGRFIEAQDRDGAEPVAVISEALARRLWPNGGAVGKRIRTAEEPSVRAPLTVWRTVVGVTANVRQTFTDDDLLDIYLPFLQAPNRFASLYLKTDAPLSSWLGHLRSVVAEINPEVAVAASPALASSANELLAGPRFLASLMTGFAVFAALLAVLGVYGVVSYGVQQREREIAIRMALGATAGGVTTMLVKHGAAILAVGIVGGLIAASGVTRMLQAQLHGVGPFDLLTLIVTAAALGSAGLLATWWPARRAARRSPLDALKGD